MDDIASSILLMWTLRSMLSDALGGRFQALQLVMKMGLEQVCGKEAASLVPNRISAAPPLRAALL